MFVWVNSSIQYEISILDITVRKRWVHLTPQITVQVKPTFQDFSIKIKKKARYALLKYFPPQKFKSKEKELSSKHSAFSRAKRAKPQKYFRPKIWAKNDQNNTVFSNIFSQTFSPGLEPFITKLIFFDFFKTIQFGKEI